jgi:2-haloacid dehalogenase
MRKRWATFDCYGTLIDWERGIAATLTRLWPDRDPTPLLNAYHRIEADVQHGSRATYRSVLTGSLVRLAAEHDLPLAETERDALARSLPEWSPFPEVPGVLAELRRRGWRLAILSNTDPDLLDASIRRIGVVVDLRITAAEAGSYKPAPGHWAAFSRRSGADRAGWIHVAASLFHDVAPANELGLPVVWIDRSDATDRQADAAGLRFAARLPNLAQLPDTLDGLTGGAS